MDFILVRIVVQIISILSLISVTLGGKTTAKITEVEKISVPLSVVVGQAPGGDSISLHSEQTVDSQAVEIIGHHSEVHSQQQHSQEQHTTTSGRPQKASSAAKASMAIQWPYQQPPPHPPQPIGLPPPVPQHNDLGYTSIHEPSGNTLNHNQLHHPEGKCCQYPACYDSIYNLCIDTCHRPVPTQCGGSARGGGRSQLKVTTWLPCPAQLSFPDCNSKSLSASGRLPIECYPDIPDILPMHFLARMGQPVHTLLSYFRPSGPLERKNDPFGAGSSSSKWDFDQGNTLEQIYREEIRKTRQKRCSRGLCIPNLDNLSTGGYRQMSRDDL